MKTLIITNEAETAAFGRNLGKSLKAGDILALTGELGSGKTTLTKYIAEGLGVKENITSPTFLIIKEYSDGRLPLYHFDVYRLEGQEEMYELGYEEYFFGDGVCVVEWSGLAVEYLPGCRLEIKLEDKGENRRCITVEPVGGFSLDRK